MKPPKMSDFQAVELPKPQTTVARCIGVIDFGTVPNVYKGETSLQRKIYIMWELPKLLAEFNKDQGPKPFTVGLEVTFSTGDNANFSKLIAQWRNKPLTSSEKETFDPMVMINKVGMVSFVHARKSKYKGQEVDKTDSSNTVLKFNGIMQKPEEVVCPPMVLKPIKWDWDIIVEGKEEFNLDKFKNLPNWMQDKMKTSQEFMKFGKYDEAEPDNEPEGEENSTSQADDNVSSGDGW